MKTDLRSLSSTAELSEEEKRKAKEWRIKKCGYDSFDNIFEKFKQDQMVKDNLPEEKIILNQKQMKKDLEELKWKEI